MLKSRGCDAMTGAGGSFLGWGSESRERNGLGRSASGRCAPIGKTSRNVKTAASACDTDDLDRDRLQGLLEAVATECNE